MEHIGLRDFEICETACIVQEGLYMHEEALEVKQGASLYILDFSSTLLMWPPRLG